MENQGQAAQISSSTKGLREVMKRLGALIDEETIALQANKLEELEYFRDRKSVV